MKKITILPVVMLLILVSCKNNRQHSLKAVSNLPSFNVLLLDSTTILNSRQIQKGGSVIFFYFQTDCSHCQVETEMLLNNINNLKNVQLYFITPMSLKELRQFDNQYHLSNYKNITIGKDYEFSFTKIFQPMSVPFIAIYNGSNELIKIYKGDTPIESLVKAIQS